MRQKYSLWYKRVELRGGRGKGRGNMLRRIHQQLVVGVAQWGCVEAEVALGFPLGQPNAAWSVYHIHIHMNMIVSLSRL
jgi:hypothetical protein